MSGPTLSIKEACAFIEVEGSRGTARGVREARRPWSRSARPATQPIVGRTPRNLGSRRPRPTVHGVVDGLGT